MNLVGIFKRGKRLPRAGQISALKGTSDGVEIQAPIRSEERIISMEDIISQGNNIVVILLGGS
jgi:hypothetical protein